MRHCGNKIRTDERTNAVDLWPENIMSSPILSNGEDIKIRVKINTRRGIVVAQWLKRQVILVRFHLGDGTLQLGAAIAKVFESHTLKPRQRIIVRNRVTVRANSALKAYLTYMTCGSQGKLTHSYSRHESSQCVRPYTTYLPNWQTNESLTFSRSIW